MGKSSDMLLNRRGASILLMSLGVSAFMGAATVAYITYAGRSITSKASEIRELDYNFANQRALALGGYLISSNLILCRADGWQHIGNKSQKCQWGGAYHVSKTNPSGIPASRYGITAIGVDGNQLKLTMKHDIDGKKIESNLYFSLESFYKDKNLRDFIGNIPAKNAVVDDDEYIVVMRAEAQYELGLKTETVTLLGAMRRPMGTPEFVADTNPSCDYSCVAGISENPTPECRGPDEVPQAGFSQVFLTVRNSGPGPIYKLGLEKRTTFDPAYYPNTPEKLDLFDAMAAADVLMPGASTKVPDKMDCVRPITVNRTVVQNVTNTVSCTTCSSSSTTSTTVSVSANVHYERTSQFSYDLNTGAVVPEYLASNLASSYDPGDLDTYQSYENKSLSYMEPKRIGKKIVLVQGSNAVPITENITTITNVTTVTVRASRPH